MYEISFFQYFRNITVCLAYFSDHLLPSLKHLSRFLHKIDGRHHTETAILQHVTVFQLSRPPYLLPGFRGEKTRKVSWEASPLNLRHICIGTRFFNPAIHTFLTVSYSIILQYPAALYNLNCSIYTDLYSSPWAASISHHSAGCHPNRLSESSAGTLSEYRLDFLLS